MNPQPFPAAVALTRGLIPTIEVEGATLTVDIARQLDTLTVEALADLQALDPICRIQTTKHRGPTEVLAWHPTTRRLIRAEIDGYHCYTDANGKSARTGQEATAWAQDNLVLAVLPQPQGPTS